MKRPNEQTVQRILPYPKLDAQTKSLNGKSSINLHEKIQRLLEVFEEESSSQDIDDAVVDDLKEDKDAG